MINIACELYPDCINDNKCHLCISGNKYIAPKIKKKSFKSIKETKRQAAISEVKAINQIHTDISGTPNSGAGKIKGDAQIRGLINVMVEIKSTTKKNINKEPGKESFTIQKKWMDKLKVEAREANMEFDYLMFSFKEDDNDFYCITNKEVITSMIATMKHDREQLQKNEKIKNIAEKKSALIDAENTKLKAEIEYLRSLLDNHEHS